MGVDDIAASEDILGEIILYNTLRKNIFVYFIMSALIFIILYFERIQVRSTLFRAPGLVLIKTLVRHLYTFTHLRISHKWCATSGSSAPFWRSD